MGKIKIPEDVAKKIVISSLLLVIMIMIGGLTISNLTGEPVNHATIMATSHITHSNPQELISAGMGERATILALNFGGYVLSFYVFYLIFEYLISGQLAETIHGVKTMKKIKNLQGHYIVCGAGRVGTHIGERLRDKGFDVVFIEKDPHVIKKLKDDKFLVYDSEPIDEDILTKVNLKKAKGLAVSLGDDAKNLMIVLTARGMSKRIKIATRASEKTIVSKLKKAGADLIILPEARGGMKLADAMRGKIDKDYILTK
jgi:voltage-gated potassium channel